MKSKQKQFDARERVVTIPYSGERKLYGIIQAPAREPRTWYVVFDCLGSPTVMHESEIELE